MALPSRSSTVLDMLREYRASLLGREVSQTERLARSWLMVEKSLMTDMQLLSFELSKHITDSGSAVTMQLLRRQERYTSLVRQIRDQVSRYSTTIALTDITNEQMAYGSLGLESAQKAIRGSYTLGFGSDFNALPVDAFEDLVGMLGNDTPLNTLLKEAYKDSAEGVTQALLSGLARGISPQQIAREMAEGLGLGLERLTLIARTEQLRVWRTSSQRQYAESGVVLGHKRLAAKDACMACLMSDGELLPIDRPLTDHPRGRCTSVPVVRGAPTPSWTTGKELFESLDPEEQRERMGNAAFEAWKSGKIELSDFVRTVHNDEWGDHITTNSLKDMLESTTSEKMLEVLPLEATTLSREDLIGERTLSSGRDFARETGSILSQKWAPQTSTLDFIRAQEGYSGEITQDQIVGNILASWTGSSGSPLSRVMMEGVIEKYGIPVPDTYPILDDQLKNFFLENIQAYQDLKDLGVLMYESTQEWFSEQGLSVITLYRDSSRITQSPFSSWSITPGGYITQSTELNRFQAEVPVSQILSIPSTGFGNIYEDEVVVLGILDNINLIREKLSP